MRFLFLLTRSHLRFTHRCEISINLGYILKRIFEMREFSSFFLYVLQPRSLRGIAKLSNAVLSFFFFHSSFVSKEFDFF